MDTAQPTTQERDEVVAAGLSVAERRLLVALAAQQPVRPDDLVDGERFHQLVEVMNAANWLHSKGLVAIEERLEVRYSLGPSGIDALERGTIELRAASALASLGGGAPLADLAAEAHLADGEIGIALGLLRRMGWATLAQDPSGAPVVTLTDEGRTALSVPYEVERVLGVLRTGPQGPAVSDATVLEGLRKRKGMVDRVERVVRMLSLQPRGARIAAMDLQLGPEVSALTQEVLSSGAWRDATFRPYDIARFAPTAAGGRLHPLTQITERIRAIFLAMGFTEIRSDFVESCFWNMDSLFIPQDHPARELQDTFYLSAPATLPLPPERVAKVAAVHRSGGGTGSSGWGGGWSEQEAARALLRTHTTVSTIRHLATHQAWPVRVFSVDRVFRNEAVSYKHLPEFQQIEGIVAEPGASLDMLVGLLREFYSRMGFSQIRIRPGYFPYTEPSVELEVQFKGRWMEMGGAGIFRPEVTAPLGVEVPVLAWGLGLERLAMLWLGGTDVRHLYQNDLQRLAQLPVL